MRLRDFFRRRGMPVAGERPDADAVVSKGPVVPSDAQIHLQRGASHLARSEWQSALEVYRDAVDAGCGSAARLGQTHADAAMGLREKAADSLEVVLALDPSHVDAMALLADIRLRRVGPCSVHPGWHGRHARYPEWWEGRCAAVSAQ